MRLPIIHQDGDLVAVDKPVAIPTHATDDDVISTDVVGITRAQLGLDYLAVHHRLDKETSGVLAFAASKEANASLAQSFSGRTAAKYYLAIVAGCPTRPHGSINAPIGKLASGVYAVGRDVPADVAQPASTRFRVEEEGPKGRYTLLSLVPETGRTHQIRLHLAYAGTPIVGDTLYNPDGRFAPRLLLHADRLELPHPISGQQLILRSRPPDIFGRILTGLPELTFIERLIDPQSDKRQLAHVCQTLVHMAQERRVPLALDPDTTAYRLLNGASDGIPGLTLDIFGGASSGNGQAGPVVGVASFYADDVAAAWSDDGQPGGAMTNSHARERLRELLPGLRAALNLTTLYLKVRPPRADALSDVERATAAPLAPVSGPAIDELVVRENGLAYLIRPAAGLSVGLFLDMRDLRARVRHWSADQNVLNLFAYTCGFGVAATAGGARRVLNIDLSRRALDWGMAAYAANGFAADRYDFVDGDVFDWLGRLARRKETFGLVIVDPPGFSRSGGPGRGGKTTSFSGARDYDSLAAQSAAVVSPGGRLVIACNQARISRRAFRDAVMTGIATTGRRATIDGLYHEPDLDFPTSGGGEPYLKILALVLD